MFSNLQRVGCRQRPSFPSKPCSWVGKCLVFWAFRQGLPPALLQGDVEVLGFFLNKWKSNLFPHPIPFPPQRDSGVRESPRDVAVGSPLDREVKEQTTLLRVTAWGDARASVHQRREDVRPQTSTCLRRCRSFFGFCPKLLYWNPVLYSLAPVLCSVMSGSLRPHGLQPTRLPCARDYPGKNTGMGCHFLLQGILRLLHWQTDSLPLSYLESPSHLLHIHLLNIYYILGSVLGTGDETQYKTILSSWSLGSSRVQTRGQL